MSHATPTASGARYITAVPWLGPRSSPNDEITRREHGAGTGVEAKLEAAARSPRWVADNWTAVSGHDDVPPPLAPTQPLDPPPPAAAAAAAAAPAMATRRRRGGEPAAGAVPPPEQLAQARRRIVQRFQPISCTRLQHERMRKVDDVLTLHWSQFVHMLFIQLFLPLVSVYWTIRRRTAVLRVVWCWRRGSRLIVLLVMRLAHSPLGVPQECRDAWGATGM